MARRLYARTARGRFTRPTLENTVGLTCYVCRACRRLNPVPVGSPKPDACHACGSPDLE